VGAQAGAALRVLMGAVLLLTGVMVGTKAYMDRRVAVAARIAPPKRPPGSKRRGRCRGPALTCSPPLRQGGFGEGPGLGRCLPSWRRHAKWALICSHLQCAPCSGGAAAATAHACAAGRGARHRASHRPRTRTWQGRARQAAPVAGPAAPAPAGETRGRDPATAGMTSRAVVRGGQTIYHLMAGRHRA